MTAMANATCQTCRYFAVAPRAPTMGDGTCRAHAPVPEGWPRTHQNEWCGEHAPKEPT